MAEIHKNLRFFCRSTRCDKGSYLHGRQNGVSYVSEAFQYPTRLGRSACRAAPFFRRGLDKPGGWGTWAVRKAAGREEAIMRGKKKKMSQAMAFIVLFGVVSLFSDMTLSLIHISEPTRLGMISYAVFCLKKKKIQGRRSLRQ